MDSSLYFAILLVITAVFARGHIYGTFKCSDKGKRAFETDLSSDVTDREF